jgi:hypothetical protein
MTDQEFQQLTTILREIRDGQRLQLERQAEALALQREQLAVVQGQTERHERIQDRAENIQVKGAELMAVARKTLFVLLPLVGLLILYVSWLIFR